MMENISSIIKCFSHNTDGLRENAKQKSLDAKKKVDRAIKQLIKEKEKVNFNSVASQAGVSKSFLYCNKLIRDQIETLRSLHEELDSPKHLKVRMTTSNKDALLAAKSKRNLLLEEENKKFKKEIARLKGIIYDS